MRESRSVLPPFTIYTPLCPSQRMVEDRLCRFGLPLDDSTFFDICLARGSMALASLPPSLSSSDGSNKESTLTKFPLLNTPLFTFTRKCSYLPPRLRAQPSFHTLYTPPVPLYPALTVGIHLLHRTRNHHSLDGLFLFQPFLLFSFG